ncbi:MAG: hypothetical protein ACI915_003950 [Gammaproteobacteria bacterium]|jgi:hypothetical protein
MRGWLCSDIEVDNLAPMSGKAHQDLQHPEAYRWHD